MSNAAQKPVAATSLQEAEFARFASLLLKLTGIHLADSKASLVEGRLRRRLESLGLNSYQAYAQLIEHDADELQLFVNALTTNKTDFFRENDHFDYLKKTVIPAVNAELPAGKPLSVWSAASSTGEEVYTTAMVLREALEPLHRAFRILGTDIDTKVLAQAEAGIYREDLVRSQVPAQYLSHHFERGSGRNAGHFRINRETRDKITFRQFNLIESELPTGISFDVIFLRNVLIYFEPKTVELVISRLVKYLAPHGYLFIGHSESLNSIRHPLSMVSSSVYTFPSSRMKK